MNNQSAEKDFYLSVGKASDFTNLKDRLVFRLFEILPGFLSWSVILLAILFSWLNPFFISVFIICFSIFWFFRTIYFSFHLWAGYKKMKRNEKIHWMEKLNRLQPENCKLQIKDWRDIYHLVVIPTYEESFDILEGAIKSLENADYPKDRMIVVLACEQRKINETKETAQKIEDMFKKRFFRFLVTWHPYDIPGEIAGKGSNETWATKIAKKDIIDVLGISYEKVLFSSFDADTCIFPQYFSCLTHYYLTSKNPTRTSYQPVPLYINNIWHAPAISRVFSFSSTFWHTINQERPEKLISFSSHSMSFKALVDIGFKQTNIVSDDSRVFWQCFLKYDGDYGVVPIYYPVSMDANVSTSFLKTMLNVYKQQRRWAYGVGDIPYFLFGFLKNKRIPFLKKVSLGSEVLIGHLSWSTVSILIFLLGWLPLFLGGVEFSQTLLSYNLPKVISRIMTFSMLGIILSVYLSFLLLPPKPPTYGRFKYLVFGFGWLLFPAMMVFFASLPALDAQTRWMLGRYMGFWVTEKVRK